MSKLSSKMKLALAGLLVLNLALVVWVVGVAPKLEARAIAKLGRGEYTLDGTDGTAFTEASLVGRPSAVFFGFTHCPDVCPTTLGDVSAWQEDLGGAAALQVFFISVDPARDTLDYLAEYVGWVPGVVGVTGNEGEVDKALQSFKIYAEKVPTDDGYTVDHAASVLLFDDQGRFVETIRYQEDHEVALEKVRRLLGVAVSS